MNNNNESAVDERAKATEDDNSLSFDNISKGEYSYQAFTNFQNYWAGPSYWRQSHNRQRSQKHRESAQSKAERRKQKQKNHKPCFTECSGEDGSDTSDNDDFLKITPQIVKKIRQCKYRQWDSEKLRLPSQCDIPRDLFRNYAFKPSLDMNVEPERPEIDTLVNMDMDLSMNADMNADVDVNVNTDEPSV